MKHIYIDAMTGKKLKSPPLGRYRCHIVDRDNIVDFEYVDNVLILPEDELTYHFISCKLVRGEP